MLEFFKKIIEYFNAQDIPYMLSGSIAMGVYVVPRATKDIDFVVHLKPDDIDSFVKYFDGAYYCSESAVKDAVERGSIFNVIDHASGFRADFVVLKNEEYRLTEFERRREVNFYDVDFYVVSAEDLLISKLIWIQNYQSPVQMADIQTLKMVSGLQVEYLDRWIKKLNLNTFNLLN